MTERFFKLLMQILRWAMHPIVVFVTLQILWVAILLLWVVWFLNQKADLTRFATMIGQKDFNPTYSIAFLTIGCVLLGMMLVGVVVLFVFAQRQSSLVRQQRNFVSSVTHELRSPLASLQLNIETMQKDNIPAEILNRLKEMALRDIIRLSTLVDRILISARLDRGILGFDSKADHIVLNDLLQEILNHNQHHDARLLIDCPAQITLVAPKIPLSLVIGNLIENAIRYSPKNSPITVQARTEGSQIHVSVTDKGIGLAVHEKHKIFKMFHRSPHAVKKAIPGTGLGLFIVRSIVEHLDGKVWAESQGLGLGSTFHVTIPIHPVKA